MNSKTRTKNWRAVLKIGSGEPGFYESERIFSDWYGTEEEAKNAGLKLYSDTPGVNCERNRHTSVEMKEILVKPIEEKVTSVSEISQRDKDLAFAKKRAIEYLDRGDKQGCAMSFMSDANKWGLYSKESSAWNLLIVSMLNPSILDKKFIEGFN